MKNTLKHTLSLLAVLLFLFACEKQTTPDPVRIQHPDQQSPFPRDDAYYARLRAYKLTNHKLAFGWYGSWTAIGASEQSRLRSVPDSVDIISMWSQWHSLSKEQIEDKAFVQQVKGTKVVFCISAKDVPEVFKDEGEITDASLVAYAKAWGKDSMDKYQYDGMDIDFETAIDHLGPLNSTPGLFKKFCEELSQYIGPKSNTGRLFLIDGNIDALDPGIAELCSYGVSQAYNCRNADDLRSRTSRAATVGWKPGQLIFTENFESLWQSGGASYSYDGEYIPSLLGMAHFAAEETAAGFGSYHMEYEYGHSDMPYKYIRQAIQIANPAPQGDYSKNLLTLNEAGEREVRLSRFPSGTGESVAIPLTASLSSVAAADMDIPMTMDNKLVAAYNDYYYTEYELIDPSAVSFSGPLHFAAGSQLTSEKAPARLIITGTTLEAGKEYMIAVHADYSAVKGVSANTAKEVLYVKITLNPDAVVNSVAFADAGRVEELSTVFAPDGTLNRSDSYDMTVDLTYGAPEDYVFTLKSDADLVAAYNAEHGTSYAVLDDNRVSVPGNVTISRGNKVSEPITLELGSPETLESGVYMIAFRMELKDNSDYQAATPGSLVKYVVFRKTVVNVEDKADSVPGTVIADMTGWGYTAPGATLLDPSSMFNGNLTEMGWYTTGTVTATVDMAESRTLAGFRICPVFGKLGQYTIYRLYDVQSSADNVTWNMLSSEVEMGDRDGDGWQYVKFIQPVTCRYLRMTYKGSDAQGNFAGCNEFNAVASNN